MSEIVWLDESTPINVTIFTLEFCPKQTIYLHGRGQLKGPLLKFIYISMQAVCILHNVIKASMEINLRVIQIKHLVHSFTHKITFHTVLKLRYLKPPDLLLGLIGERASLLSDKICGVKEHLVNRTNNPERVCYCIQYVMHFA